MEAALEMKKELSQIPCRFCGSPLAVNEDVHYWGWANCKNRRLSPQEEQTMMSVARRAAQEYFEDGTAFQIPGGSLEEMRKLILPNNCL